MENAILQPKSPNILKIFVLSEDSDFEAGVLALAESMNLECERVADFDAVKQLVDVCRPTCVVLDLAQPRNEELIRTLARYNSQIDVPILICLSDADVRTTAEYFKAGVLAVLEKPLQGAALSSSIAEALECDRLRAASLIRYKKLHSKFLTLTERRLKLLINLLGGKSNKWIAELLAVSKRTVELDRAEVMNSLGAESTTELVRYAIEYSMLSKRLQSPCVLILDEVDSKPIG